MSSRFNTVSENNTDENLNRNKVQDRNLKHKDSIESIIGKGNEAKNSIIWVTIRWCLAIPLIITGLFFISLWISYFVGIESEYKDLKDYMLKIWSTFAPIITLALGYLYGKAETTKEEE